MADRLLVVAPGRGTYARDELGTLRRLGPLPEAAAAILAQADARRARAGLPTVSELDAAPAFKARLHLAGENASALIATLSAIDFACLEASGAELCGVTGNSMGWYTTLFTSGALPFDDALRIVEAMGARQRGRVIGGQLILPICDEQWRPDPARRAEVLDALRRAGDEAFLSIELGGFLVLAGSDAGLERLLAELPRSVVGEREYPFRLAFHSAFHTPLMSEAAAEGRAAAEAEGPLKWQRLRRVAIDGQGGWWGPYGAADPEALARYTFGAQVLEPYGFTAALRVALRELRPDKVVLLGPGSSLGSAIAQVMIQERWRGLSSKDEFLAAQAGPDRPLIALGRPEQRRDALEAGA